MNPKLTKINAEYEKNKSKISELQSRQKELDKQRTELENLDIIGIVRETGISPDELAALIMAAKNNSTAINSQTIKEDTDNEEV